MDRLFDGNYHCSCGKTFRIDQQAEYLEHSKYCECKKLIEEKDKRIQVLEASLADVKNQVEQVRKETAQDIIDIIERLCPVCAVLSEYNTPMIQELTGCRSYMAVKSKYGIK
jgi:hypothetical protein